ncbi:MAG: VOC family protein [bacterium]|nr:VOC family protein [bacterium]
MNKVTPFLMFNNNAGEAIEFYKTVFKDIKTHDFNGMTGTFEINGQTFMVFNGGPTFQFSEAFSLFVNCEDQAEVDEVWNKFIANGGEESQCGWLKDKFGLSWQIIPKALGKYLGDPDREKANRALQAMLKMKKIIVTDLETAFNQA